jgi:PHD/YefM family antitoxin component YafN of YafNO toxin-antitoxin module
MEKKIADLTVNEFQSLIDQSMHKAFEDISEDILALSSPGYLESIEEARKDFKEGKTKTFNVLTNKER